MTWRTVRLLVLAELAALALIVAAWVASAAGSAALPGSDWTLFTGHHD